MRLRLLSTCMVSTLLKSVDIHVHFVVVLTDKTTNGPSSKKSKNEKKKGKNSGNEKENVSWLTYFVSLYICFVCLVFRLFVFFAPHSLRAVKKFLSSRLIMNSRRLWNSHQRHKFLRNEASGDILKFRVSEIAFPIQRFSRGIFHRGPHVVSSEYTQDWEQCRRNVPSVPPHRTVRTFHRSKPV